MPQSKKKQSQGPSEQLALTVDDLRLLLPLGKTAAYSLAQRIGVRLGGPRGKIIVTRAALDRWLESPNGGAP